jgi:hypothetical protein
VAAVAAAGSFIILSDDLSAYGVDEWAIVERLRAETADRDRPLDIIDPFSHPLVIGGHKVGWTR